MIADNIRKVLSNIKTAAERVGRNPKDVKLICVTKGRGIDEIKETISCGVTDIGENRVQEAKEKYNQLIEICHPEGAHSLRSVQAPRPKDFKRPFAPSLCSGQALRAQDDKIARWHMIGHLQTNKARDAVRIFDLIHSVDSLELAQAINKEAARADKIQDILLEVNTSGEEAKFGVRPIELIELTRKVVSLDNVKVLGLMTMAPVVRDKEEARVYFKKLRELKEGVNNFLVLMPDFRLTALSMGMSQDYEAAVEEGATMVRIGTAVFEG